MTAPTAEEEKLNAYRDLVNRRSVTRADPAVTDIIDTCSFCSIWVFDTQLEEWRKQKQEGALFLVRRRTDPVNALYLLNRAGVKNVLLPLIPEEIKLTRLDDGMLAIQRRGEGVQRAIYFGDGLEVRERFADGIFRICGEPVPLHPGQAKAVSNVVPVQPVQPTAGVQQVDDTFHKLFAGLGPPSASTSHAQPAVQTTTTHTQSQTQTSLPLPSTTYTQTRTIETMPAPPVPAASRPPARPDTPPTPPITFSPPITAAPVPQQPRSPIPQTADQLLSSIMGMGSPPPRPPSQQPIPAPQAPPALGPASPPPGLPLQQPPTAGLPQTADGLLSSMMGFAPRPPLQQTVPPMFAAPPPPVSAATPPPPQLQNQPEPVPSPARMRDRPPHLDAPPPSNTPPIPQLDGNLLADHRGVVSDIVVDSLPLNFRPNGAGPDPRLAFKLDLLDLIQRDPGFVEHLYNSFCARQGQGR